jgi:hypothetical protein
MDATDEPGGAGEPKGSAGRAATNPRLATIQVLTFKASMQ